MPLVVLVARLFCAARPAGCSHDLDPVCGVNGFTSPNACMLRAARIRLAHPGRC